HSPANRSAGLQGEVPSSRVPSSRLKTRRQTVFNLEHGTLELGTSNLEQEEDDLLVEPLPHTVEEGVSEGVFATADTGANFQSGHELSFWNPVLLVDAGQFLLKFFRGGRGVDQVELFANLLVRDRANAGHFLQILCLLE